MCIGKQHVQAYNLQKSKQPTSGSKQKKEASQTREAKRKTYDHTAAQRSMHASVLMMLVGGLHLYCQLIVLPLYHNKIKTTSL